MKYSPRQVILIAVSRYISEVEMFNLKTELIQKKIKDKYFYTLLDKYFDIEKLKDQSYIWQDIWIYNYIRYDAKAKPKRYALLLKYEREVINPCNQVYREFIEMISDQ